jgi:RNA polymerase sigma-70 factor (ECF subfamily)
MQMTDISRTNQEWLQALNASGPLQEAAIIDLRDLLLRAALYFFSRNLGDFRGMSRDEILERAEDCAQDALMAVLNHLPDFRGDSKFTTWAYKFAINTALMASRHERSKGISLDALSASTENTFSEWVLKGKADEVAPEQSAMQNEARKIIGAVIEQDLTDKQRQVLIMMVFNEIPMDEVVGYLGVNRNAIYKMLHDARRKLRNSLQEHGFGFDEMLILFGNTR